MPNEPNVPNAPNVPKMPNEPNVPNAPNVPKMPNGAAMQWIIEQLRFDRAGRAVGLADPPDWNQVVALAQDERLAELLLASRAAETFPPAAREQLKQARRHTLLRNDWLLRQLADGLARFDAANIPTIVLKGAAMIALVYSDFALRPMLDLDVLVPRADFERAGALLGVPIGGFLYERATISIPWLPWLNGHYAPFIACALLLLVGWVLALTTIRDTRPTGAAPASAT